MQLENLICPNCSSTIDENVIAEESLICPHCKVNWKQKKFLSFIEYLMEQGFIEDIDFFDKSLYGDEIQLKTIEEKELDDETNPDDFEDVADKIELIDETADLKEVTTDEQEFRKWDGIEEDWQEFNKKEDNNTKKN